MQILVCMTIPLATNTLLDFHMATNSHLVAEKGSSCALLKFWAQEVPKAKSSPADYGMSKEFSAKQNNAVLAVWGYSVKQTTF